MYSFSTENLLFTHLQNLPLSGPSSRRTMAFSEDNQQFVCAFGINVYLFGFNSQSGEFEEVNIFVPYSNQKPTVVTMMHNTIYCGYTGTYNALWRIYYDPLESSHKVENIFELEETLKL